MTCTVTGRSLSVVPGVEFEVRQTAHGTVERWGRTVSRGSVSIEVAVLAPAFIALMVLAGVAGRTAVADEAVESAAHDAARAASISRDATTARREAPRRRPAASSTGGACPAPTPPR